MCGFAAARVCACFQQTELLADKEFGLTHTHLGMLQSAVAIPNLFMPLLGGLFLDLRGNARGTLLALALCLVGHLAFVIACLYRSFIGALLGRIVFGLGQGSTVVAQGRICATWFMGREMVFAIALTESTHNLSNFIAFVYVVPVSEAMGGYIWAFWMGAAFCAMSLVCAILYFRINGNAEPSQAELERLHDYIAEHGHHPADADRMTNERRALITAADHHSYESVASSDAGAVNASNHREVSWLSRLEGLTLGFFVLCLIHMTYSNCYHLFAYISATLIRDRFHTTVAKAGWLAGLSNGLAIVLCPIAGLLMDWFGYKMWLLAACGLLSTLAYFLLLWHSVSPVPSLVLLAVCVSFSPTIMKSSVPNVVLPSVFGVGYGIYQVSESLGSVIGNPVVGWLRDQSHSWDSSLTLFMGLALTATALTLLLILLDRKGCIGIGAHGRPMGGLNESSFADADQQAEEPQHRHHKHVEQKRQRWKEIEEEERREKEQQQQPTALPSLP